jgi:hypothetical protein
MIRYGGQQPGHSQHAHVFYALFKETCSSCRTSLRSARFLTLSCEWCGVSRRHQTKLSLPDPSGATPHLPTLSNPSMATSITSALSLTFNIYTLSRRSHTHKAKDAAGNQQPAALFHEEYDSPHHAAKVMLVLIVTQVNARRLRRF